MFAGLGSESAHDDGGEFNLFSQDETPDVSKTTTGATGKLICICMGLLLVCCIIEMLLLTVCAVYSSSNLCCSLPYKPIICVGNV